MAIALIVLAAGQGSRMNSDLPKVLHPIGNAPLFSHALASGSVLEPEKTVLVTGVGADAVEAAAKDIDPDIVVIRQTEQLGTGHAVAQAANVLQDFAGDTLVLYGDTPFIQPETLTRMQNARLAGFDVVVLGFEASEPGRYGRLVMDGDSLLEIVEFKDTSPEQRAITLCNSGVIMACTNAMFDLVNSLDNENASGEYYLTDIVGLARSRGMTATVVTCDEAETLGINTRAELASAERIFQTKARADLLELGVTMTAPETVFLSHDTYIGRDVMIEPNVIFGPGVTVETGAIIRAFSHLEGCHVSQGAVVGPYARLRPGAEIGNDAKVGNFVEIKSAIIQEGAKVSHLSYIGNASVGAGSNIGAGTITCNYNGVEKFQTEIGARALIGSNTMLVAPVRVGNDAMTGSGSVITKDVPDGALSLSRPPQAVKPGVAYRLFDMYKKAKDFRQKAD